MTYAPKHYVLDDNNVPQRATSIEAARFFRLLKRRHVGLEEIGGCVVSTVFLGVDHNFSGRGPPLLFETMVFVGDSDGVTCQRYSTWDDAFLGHRAKVRELQQATALANALLDKVR